MGLQIYVRCQQAHIPSMSCFSGRASHSDCHLTYVPLGTISRVLTVFQDHSGHRISIVSHTHAITVALSILQGLVSGVLAQRQVRVFYADLIPRLAFASNRVVEILLDKAVPIITLQKRASLLERITKTLAVLVECSEHAQKITQPSIFRLLLARLEIGEGDIWHGCDEGLVVLLQSTSVQTILRGDIVDGVGGVSSEQWNALAEPLRVRLPFS